MQLFGSNDFGNTFESSKIRLNWLTIFKCLFFLVISRQTFFGLQYLYLYFFEFYYQFTGQYPKTATLIVSTYLTQLFFKNSLRKTPKAPYRLRKLLEIISTFGNRRFILLLGLSEFDHYIEDDPPNPHSNNGQFKMWHSFDRIARVIIGLPLSNDKLEHVKSSKMAKRIWQAILNVFGHHSLLNKGAARRNF